MNPEFVMKIFSFLFGLILGSFANVCIYRIPLKKSLIYPSSTCPSCGEKIRFYDNIPILSYLILGAKCRNCGTRISIRYPVVELIFGILSLAIFTRYGLSYQYFIYVLFLGALVVCTFIDIDHQIIPDVISIPGILAGFGASLLFSNITWLDSLIGIVGGGGSLYLIAVIFEYLTGKEGMGGGDIKLLAMIGGWLGWQALPLVILISSFTGTIIGGGALVISRKGYSARIPFGPFLSLGTVIYFFFGHEIIRWYSGFLA